VISVIRYLFLSTCLAAASSSVPSATLQAAGQMPTRELDSIPSKLLAKMLRGGHRLVGSPGLTWKNQQVITVAFYGGSNDLYQLIESTANEWTALGKKLTFSFKTSSGKYRQWTPKDTGPSANIRIAFDSSGYWSLIGVLAKNMDPSDPTMNFAGFPEDLSKYYGGANSDDWHISYAHTTILHEFGHALGLSHEHFNAGCQADLKLPDIIKFLEGPPNNWTEEQARFNIDAKYYAEELGKQAGPSISKLIESATTDQSSVMLYLFSTTYYKSGDTSVCRPIGDHGQEWPTTLSTGDKEFYLDNYERQNSSPFGASIDKTRGAR
jgi:hypothetical protein